MPTPKDSAGRFPNLPKLDETLDEAELHPAGGGTGVPSIDKTAEIHDKIQKLKKEGYLDLASNCLNRNYFERLVEKYGSEIGNNQVGIIFIDLNNLKVVNDTYNHNVGDAFIKNTANYLKEFFRDDDEVIRYGGDEIVIVCLNRNQNPNFEASITERIKEAFDLATTKIKVKGVSNIVLNFSYGVAAFQSVADTTLEDVKTRAERKMMRLKRKMKFIAYVNGEKISRKSKFKLKTSHGKKFRKGWSLEDYAKY